MKHTLLLTFSCILISQSHLVAQFPAFPDSSAFWLMGVFDGPNQINSYGFHLKSTNHDTIIGGESFNSLWHGMEGQGVGFAGGIREIDNMVYYYHPNTDSTYLLYDFDPLIGDSLDIWNSGSDVPFSVTHRIYIESIDTFINNIGTTYKVIGILDQAAIQGSQGVSNWWIQGVGGTGGLLSTSGSLTVSIYTTMACMSHNDSIWPSGAPGMCSTTLIIEEETIAWSATPNPSTGHFTFDSTPEAAGQQPKQIVVYDAFGREVLQTFGTSVDLSGEPEGVYVARVFPSSASGNRVDLGQVVRLVVVR